MKIRYQSLLTTTPVPRGLVVPYLDPNTDKIQLTRDFQVFVYDIDKTVYGLDRGEYLITIPEGFIVDGSTIPRFLWAVFHPFDTEALRGSVTHDMIYSKLYKQFPKLFADDVLRECMRYDGATELKANVFRKGVGMFGKGGWVNNY